MWTAHERSTAWNAILTQVKTDDGLTGYGIIHAGPAPRVCEWVARFGEFVHGMDALATIAVWEKLFALTSPRPGAIEGRADIPPPIPRPTAPWPWRRSPGSTSRCGTSRARPPACRSTACSAARTGRSSPTRPAAITGGVSNEEYGEELARFLELGYRAVKLKCGAGTVAEEAAADRRGAQGDRRRART